MNNNLTDKFMGSSAGNIVEFTPDIQKTPVNQFKIKGTGVLVAQNLKDGQLYPKGESYPVFFLDNNAMIIRLNDGFYYFDRPTILTGESAKEFVPHAIEFGKRNQAPGSYSFQWQGMELSFIDIGYLIYTNRSGSCHLNDKTAIRFILAQLGNGDRFYLEDCKNGTDRSWLGTFLGSSLEQNILSIN